MVDKRRITVKQKRNTPDQVVRKLREADRMVAEGADVAAICRQLEVSEQTYFRWRKQYGSMRPDDVKRMKDLEKENSRLKHIVADLTLDVAALKDVAEGKY
jgi:putative transposase